MVEYIEREAAIIAIKNLYPGIPLAKIRLQKWHDENKNFMECELAIERIPAADVAPVRHGRWIEESPDFLDGDSVYVCSVCGETWTLIEGTPLDNNMHYCPNCGAWMTASRATVLSRPSRRTGD